MALALAWLAFALAPLALALAGPVLPLHSDDLTGLLISAGCLCLGALLLDRSRPLVWPSLTVASIAATRLPVRAAGEIRPDEVLSVDTATWIPVALVVAVCATLSAAVAALYATHDDSGQARAPISLAAAACVAVVATSSLLWIGLIATGVTRDARPMLAEAMLVPIRGWLLIVLGLAAWGAAIDVRPAIRRARARIAASRDLPPGPAPRLAILADELLGRGEGRRAGAEAERHRLALELHAEAMPELRRAMAHLGAGRPPELVATELGSVADRLEGAVTARRDPVLEALGLVAALERLAERTEDRGGPTVLLDVEEAPLGRGASGERAQDSDRRGPSTTERPPLAVEAAALRVAWLAVDNAARHADARLIHVVVGIGPRRVRLEVRDDGVGIAPDAEVRAARDGRHGLRDMRALATDHAARLTIEPLEGGGTTVAFAWPS